MLDHLHRAGPSWNLIPLSSTVGPMVARAEQHQARLLCLCYQYLCNQLCSWGVVRHLSGTAGAGSWHIRGLLPAQMPSFLCSDPFLSLTLQVQAPGLCCPDRR